MGKMRRITIEILLGAALLLISLAGGAAAETEVTRATLDNGLRVIIVVDRLAPVVEVQVNYLVGANETPEGFPGTAHALEHMMFRGSPGLSADQLATIMAALGGDSNAMTQQTVTRYFVAAPAEELEAPLRVEALRMSGISSTEEVWEKERGAIEQEVAQDLSEPMYIFHTRLQARMFAGTPYAVDALGTKPSFDKTTGKMLRKFHRQWYGPNNAILIIVGDVDPRSTLKLVRRIYGEIPRRPVPDRPQIELEPAKPSVLDMETDLPYGLAVTAYRLPGYDSPDYAAGLILGDVLDSRRGRLYDLVIKGEALTTGFSTEEQAPATIGYIVATYPKGGDGAALVERLREIAEEYRREGVKPELVKAAREREIAEDQFAKNSIEGLAFAWSQAVAVEGRNSPDDDIEAIRKVTAADVNRVLRQYLRPETAITAVLTPRQGGKPMAGGQVAGKEAFTPKEVKPVPLPDWAKDLGKPKIRPPAPAPHEFRLDNGLRLIVRPLRISPTISLYGAVRNRAEIQEPHGKEGVSDLLSALFSYGTESLDRLAFRKAVDDIAAHLSVGTGFSLQTLDDRFERGVALLADNLLHPALPEEAFTILRREDAAALAGERQSPDYHARRTLLKALFPADDPVLREATPETVEGLRYGDVKAYHQKVFRPDQTTIVIVGKIDAEEARRMIAKYFGGWRAEGKPPELDLPAVPSNKPSIHLIPDPDRVQDLVTLAQVGDVSRTGHDYYPLQVGMHVLSGGFYATRFFRDLREESGLVYSVGGRLDAGPNRSILTVSYGCEPDNVGKARTIIEKDLLTMQEEEVSPDELRRAKSLLLLRELFGRSSVSGIAGQDLELVHDRLPLDEPQKAAQRIIGIGADEVKKAFARNFRPEDLVQVTQGPAPR